VPDGRAFHLMDLMVGESLRKRLRRGPLHASEAASVIDEIASALIAGAATRASSHRDLQARQRLPDRARRGVAAVKLLVSVLAKLMPEAGPARSSPRPA